MKTANRDQGKTSSVQQLLAELDQLEQEHRALDLRDTTAVEHFQYKIKALRQRIALLRSDPNDS
jgi:hypothetical protein